MKHIREQKFLSLRKTLIKEIVKQEKTHELKKLAWEDRCLVTYEIIFGLFKNMILLN